MTILADTVSSVATVVTLATNGTTVYAMYLIWKQKNTNNFLLLPYVVMFITSLSWSLYGAMTETYSVEFVSGVNSMFNLSYVLWYVRHAQHKKQAAFMVILGGSSLISYLLYFRYSLSIDAATAVNELGLVCDAITIVQFFSPLSALGDVIRTKCSETIPLALVSMNFFVAGLWWYYGYLLEDNYIVFPNMVGCFFAFIQVTICFIFPRQPAQTKPQTSSQPTSSQV